MRCSQRSTSAGSPTNRIGVERGSTHLGSGVYYHPDTPSITEMAVERVSASVGTALGVWVDVPQKVIKSRRKAWNEKRVQFVCV